MGYRSKGCEGRSVVTRRVAIVICPPGQSGENIHRKILGLDVGERLLLALGHGGVEKVVFTGMGPRPQSDRAPVKITSAAKLSDRDLEEGFFVLPSDLVFDRALLQSPLSLPDGIPIQYIPDDAFDDVMQHPENFLEKLGHGHAVSGRGFALRVTDDTSAKAAQRALLLSLRKPIDGLVARHINRYISLFFTKRLVGLGIRPNQLTVGIMAMGLLSGVLAAVAEPWWVLVLAALLFQGQSIFDGCDGEVARLTYRFSHLGQWLDTIGDDFTNYVFCLGLAVGQARLTGWTWLYFAAGAVLLMQIVSSGIMYRRMILMGTGDLLAVPVLVGGGGKGSNKVFNTLRQFFKRDAFVLIIALLAAFQLPLVAFVTMGLGTVPVFVGVIINDIKVGRLQNRS